MEIYIYSFMYVVCMSLSSEHIIAFGESVFIMIHYLWLGTYKLCADILPLCHSNLLCKIKMEIVFKL